MTQRILKAVLVAIALALIAAPRVLADSTSGALSSASFTPAGAATAGSADSTSIALTFTYSGSDTAKSLTITFPAGFLAAPAAVATTCSSTQLAASACPGAAEIGTGQASVGTVIGPQTATLGIYLMPAPTSTSVVGIGVELNATVLGIPIMLTASGSAGFITGATGQPQLQISLPSLPASAPVPVIGSVAIQLNQLTMTLDGSAPSGKQFLYLPTNCSVASAAFAVSTVNGATGSATASFTPTGCPLTYTGGSLNAAAQVVDTNFDVALQTDVGFPTGGANTSVVTLDIPTTALRANPLYAQLSCPSTAPFTGCAQIGTVSATTPLLSAPLSGVAYLTGSVAGGFGLGLYFPAPFGIALSGTVMSDGGVTQVNFPSVPDLPLSALQLSLTGSNTSAFQASCGAGTQLLTAKLTGAGGAGTLTKTSPLQTTGCPAQTSSGTGTQVASYPSTASPNKKTTPPRVTVAELSGVATGRPTMRFTLRAGSSQLKSFVLKLPNALTFVSRRLAAALHGSVSITHRLAGRSLTVTLKRPANALTVRVAVGGLASTVGLKREVRARRTERLTFKLSVRSVKTRAVALNFSTRALR